MSGHRHFETVAAEAAKGAIYVQLVDAKSTHDEDHRKAGRLVLQGPGVTVYFDPGILEGGKAVLVPEPEEDHRAKGKKDKGKEAE